MPSCKFNIEIKSYLLEPMMNLFYQICNIALLRMLKIRHKMLEFLPKLFQCEQQRHKEDLPIGIAPLSSSCKVLLKIVFEKIRLRPQLSAKQGLKDIIFF
jgi:hypothetical protein